LEALGEEENFEVFDFAGSGIEAGDHVVAEFFGFLVGVGGTGVEVQNIADFVVAQHEIFFHGIVWRVSWIFMIAGLNSGCFDSSIAADGLIGAGFWGFEKSMLESQK
jgi:hypothetical protein